jgi:glycosyltransferase involved in cell wall biosynthesis
MTTPVISETTLPAIASDVSVLMATYASETASHLSDALESLFKQTVCPQRIILVIDGPIGGDQHAVIAHYITDQRGPELIAVPLAKNSGLAAALNAGLTYCDTSYLMRMDSDDIATPDRLALQRSYLEAHPDIAMVSSWAREFSDHDESGMMKVSPTDHGAVAIALRWRNVIVHSAVMFRTDRLRSMGAYRSDFGLLEDYDLFVRLIAQGEKLHVLPKVLVRLRTGPEQKSRRGNLTYLKNEIRFRIFCFRIGFLNGTQFLATTVLYSLFRVIGSQLRQRVYALART